MTLGPFNDVDQEVVDVDGGVIRNANRLTNLGKYDPVFLV